MIAGRKLLLADDSVAIQKVIDLTFTDEGMEVTTVGDGNDALAKLEQVAPDVVLADIFMPGVDGYELCKVIKNDERFRDVPVMLLVGSFEPFDKGEAERAGADDVVTKPFQSIRDLVSRVGSLISGDAARNQTVANSAESPQAAANVESVAETFAEPAREFVEARESFEQPEVKVFVEAPMMESEVEVQPEHTCPPDIELQTADTQQLDPVHPNVDFDESINVEVVDEGELFESGAARADVQPEESELTAVSAAAALDDEGVLDLGDIDGFAAATTADDFELDLDVEPVAASGSTSTVETESVSSDSVTPSPAHERETEAVAETVHASASDERPTQLSAEAIEAISQRVVEKLSDQVVREIAWEVVPELSELLIKKQLQERH